MWRRVDTGNGVGPSLLVVVMGLGDAWCAGGPWNRARVARLCRAGPVIVPRWHDTAVRAPL
ncbi:MAG: hypothetical protein K6T83_02875, partial [Alicyclobacillus sp.]|nr:hypothetical protein [Alicyclobacillus sp.]